MTEYETSEKILTKFMGGPWDGLVLPIGADRVGVFLTNECLPMSSQAYYELSIADNGSRTMVYKYTLF